MDASATPARPAMRGVYLIRSGQYVKIGYTDSFGTRFAQYLLHNPQATLEAFIPTDQAIELERYLHLAFAPRRHRGEWFDLDDAGVKAAVQMADKVSATHLAKLASAPQGRSAPVTRGDPEDLGGGRWKARVFFERDEHGKQMRKSKTFKADGIRRARIVARQIEAELREEYEQSKGHAADTFAEATERWWGLWRRRNRSPTTRQSYRSIIDTHILQCPMVGRKVKDLKVGDFDRWYADLAELKSPATVRRIHAVVVQVLDQCMRDGDLPNNPAALAHKPETRTRRRPRTHASQVIEILAAAAQRSPVRARTLAFAALTGLRRGELIGIRWSRVDLEKGTLIVEFNTVTAQRQFIGDPEDEPSDEGRRMRRHVKDPKAHQVAAIALGDQATELARMQMEWQRSEAAYAMAELPEDPWLWQVTVPFHEPMWPDTVSHWMAEARDRAGLPGIRLHDLRHYQASVMLEVGGTVEDVRERLRHRSIQTTMGYLEADTSKQKVLVALLPDLQLPS